MRILVTGASGFIGHHLARKLKKEGHFVRGVDWKKPEYGNDFSEFLLKDLRNYDNCLEATKGMDRVYALAADMGGMGFIQDPKNQYRILYNNTKINFNTLEASRQNKIKRYLYTSSACIYPEYKQTETNVKPLKESDAYPAQPQDSYGWEKLQAEHLCACSDLDTRIVRFHNIYGIEGTWQGGREKAPAAFCRKIIDAQRNKQDYIEMWGDGKQTRSFCYIDDCLKAIQLVMEGDYKEPVNVGRDELTSMNDLAKIVMKKVNLKIKHIKGPEGVRGRNSDNSEFKRRYNWAPEIDLKEGMAKTYKWIKDQMIK